MEHKTSTSFIRKRYILSLLMLAAATFSSTKAFSQVDYFYGLNRTGFRVSVGVAGGKLDSSWGSNPLSIGGTANIDYDITQYFSIGFAGQYGKLQGKDSAGKLTPGGTDVTYGGGDINFKIAIGQFLKNPPKNIGGDIIRRIYVGTGIGFVSGDVVLKPHTDGKKADNPYNHYLEEPKMRSLIDGFQQAKGSGSDPYVPINVGTYISLRKLTKKDKFEINPNYQYNFVNSVTFDGYRPSTTTIGPIKKNGNQGYALYSISLRYKF